MTTSGTATRTITNAWVNRTLPDIFYEEPERVEDGMEQDLSIRRISQLLFERYQDRPDVFMSGIVFISYDIENGNRRVAPDFFIAFDVPKDEIRKNLPNFWLWEIDKVPDFAMEVASPSTAQNDIGHKRDLYARLGITEYWRFDASGGDYYGQPLAGDRLIDGKYQPYEVFTEADGSARAYSELLEVEFYWDGQEFDVLDPITGKTIDRREPEREARMAEREARLAAEAREREARIAEHNAIVAEREARLAAEARERELLEEIESLRRRISE
ncbi:MAG: Uma2 family endonuclease [Chloroflexi bacterium]|nr:Uma2 family endonuclease [Chloroflexota bacterium]